MDILDVDGKTYSFLIGGDVARNGAYIEVREDAAAVVAELFCPYGKQDMLLTSGVKAFRSRRWRKAARIARRQGLVAR